MKLFNNFKKLFFSKLFSFKAHLHLMMEKIAIYFKNFIRIFPENFLSMFFYQ